LADGTPDEAILSLDEAKEVFGQTPAVPAKVPVADAEKTCLLIESTRIRLAYAHDRQFAVSLSGIHTLLHQIEAVCLKMLPQPRSRFLQAEVLGTGIRRIKVKGRKRGQPIRLTTSEWYKAAQLGDSYWLYVVWDPLDSPSPELLRIQSPAKHLDHAKREIVAARYYDIPAEAVEQAANRSLET